MILKKLNCNKTLTFLLSTDDIHDDEEHTDMAHIISIEGTTFRTDEVFLLANRRKFKGLGFSQLWY